MSSWLTPDGKRYEERQAFAFETEEAARAALVALGAVLVRERMTGAYYRTPAGRSFRITKRSWADGYIVLEAVERAEARR